MTTHETERNRDETVIDQLATIRESGETNMLDKPAVQRLAFERDLYELVIFCEDASPHEYTDLLKRMGEQR